MMSEGYGFDYFYFAKELADKIQFDPTGYQSTDFSCYGTRFDIDADGVIKFTPNGTEEAIASDKENTLFLAIEKGFTGSIEVYSDLPGVGWVEYFVYFENNKLVYVKNYAADVEWIADESKREQWLAHAWDEIAVRKYGRES